MLCAPPPPLLPSPPSALQDLLTPLEKAGVLVKRSREELRELLPNFTVLERETKVLGCALLLPLGATPDGQRVAEIGAFCVDPVFRGSGRGDSLLDYVEQVGVGVWWGGGGWVVCGGGRGQGEGEGVSRTGGWWGMWGRGEGGREVGEGQLDMKAMGFRVPY